ncbi:hypothetical protein [Kangiella sp. M94]
MSYKELIAQLNVAFDTENDPMMLASLKDMYYEFNDLDAGLLFAINSMMCSEGYFEESEETLIDLLDTRLEQSAAVWLLYMHTRMFTIYDNLDRAVESLYKFPKSSVGNYALAFYHDYNSNNTLSKHHIDISIELDEYPANLIFYARNFCKERKQKLAYIEKALKNVIKRDIEEDAFPNTINEYLDDYNNELLLQRIVTSSNWRIMTREAEELRGGFWQKVRSIIGG